MKYTKKQIQEAINYWQGKLNEIDEDKGVPTISSITEFLSICKDRGLKVEKKQIAKQGKVVSAHLADKDETIMSREGKETAKKGSLIIDDGNNTFYAVPAENISKYYEVDKDGNSATGDNAKWKKIGKTLDYYVTPFDVDIEVSWQKEPLHATKGYSLVCNDKDGKDISPVAPEVFKDETLWKPVKYDELVFTVS